MLLFVWLFWIYIKHTYVAFLIVDDLRQNKCVRITVSVIITIAPLPANTPIKTVSDCGIP